MNPIYRQQILSRLNNNCKITSGNCHIWIGNIHERGYGTTHMFGRIWKVHRLATIFFSDLELETKIYVKHKCKNRSCFNPDHLDISIKQDL